METPATCLDLHYDDISDMLVWTIKFDADESIKSVVSPASSFSEAVGIKGKVTKADWSVFCQNMKNKKINFSLPKG